MNSGYFSLFHKVFCTFLFSPDEQKAVTLLHGAYIKRAFLVKTKENSESKKKFSKKHFSVIVASDISTPVHKVATGCRYLKYLTRR